jgi:hypothetical protein
MTEKKEYILKVSDEKFEEKYEEELESLLKEENQLEKVEPVTKALSSMGRIWKEVSTKLSTDKICYLTKEPIQDEEEFDIITVPSNKLPPGMVAFVSIKKTINTEE